CQRHNFGGPVCGPKPTYENKREFTDTQLNASKTIIGLQAGYNKGANQSGLSFGAGRHVADLKVDEMSAGGKTAIDIKVDQMSSGGQGVIGLQAGSNQGASQSGMSMGSVRHIGDIQSGELSRSGQGHIGLQAGSNQGASQVGMSFGTQRHINDLNVGGSK
ncbi:unnamed protein product, partial [Dibothriocephalus latus]